jgi:hypothetical protein
VNAAFHQSTYLTATPTGSSALEWDAFAQSCDASFRCSHPATRLWQVERHLAFRLLRLDINLPVGGDLVKIGQCAIGKGRKLNVFSDSLQVLPEYRHLWPAAMRAVLVAGGEGTYHYGSDWNLEPCRADFLRALDGVTVEDVHPVDVVAIDFSRWATWEAYYKAVSQNARRNSEKVHRHYADLSVQRRHGVDAFRDIVPLQLLRRKLFERKSVSSSLAGLVARSGYRLAATTAYSHSGRLKDGRRVLARNLCIDFGRSTFYMEAAAAECSGGESTYLLRATIQEAYARSRGRGTFVMGPDDHKLDGDPQWEGLRRSRDQWRATARPTSMIRFTYLPTISGNANLRKSPAGDPMQDLRDLASTAGIAACLAIQPPLSMPEMERERGQAVTPIATTST